MKYIFVIFIISLNVKTFGVFVSDCKAIKKEIDIFRKISPSGVQIYKNDFDNCNIFQINGLSINDYFQTEYDTLLALSFIAIDRKITHPKLLDYQINNNRWDLLLINLDTIRTFDQQIQIRAVNHLFYKNLPRYFDAEIKEIFNFLTESEKITMSQQLIPINAAEIEYLLKRNNYIYEFWPLFDQMVFINHLRELYPFQFEKLSQFWREKLVSYYYEGIEDQNPSFKVLSNLLNRSVINNPVNGANPSLQFYYFLKLDLNNEATAFLNNNDKIIFFNVLRYFKFFNLSQQNFLLDLSINFSISDIKRLFNDYYFQMDNYLIQQFIWEVAYNNNFNCEENLKNPMRFLKTLPYQYKNYLDVLSPTMDYITKNESSLTHYFNNDPTNKVYASRLSVKEKAEIIRFYNDFKKIPFKQTSRLIKEIFPYIKIKSHQDFLDLIPYITVEQQFELIEQNNFLEKMPTPNRAQWSHWVQPNLAKIYFENYPQEPEEKEPEKPKNKFKQSRKRSLSRLRN